MRHSGHEHWRHSHVFGLDERHTGEVRTILVVIITLLMMAVEIGAGILYGSMALLADGLHMGSHAAALSISAFAYIYARRHAHDDRYSFGTGKVNALSGFTGALLLALFALLMGWQSVERLLAPVTIAIDQAIFVAVIGLAVNGVSALILNHSHDDHHEHAHGEDHGDDEEHDHDHSREHRHDHDHHAHDHNLRSAYLHVLADALTSLLAILALLAAKYYGLLWMDPVMGVLGALLVMRWSFGLLGSSSAVLLDRQGPQRLRRRIRHALERDGSGEVVDLHLWAIGPNRYGLIVAVQSHTTADSNHFRARLPHEPSLVHVTIEVHYDAERALSAFDPTI